jgi:hypothetical protein
MSGVEHTNSTDTLENKAVSYLPELVLFGVEVLAVLFFIIMEFCSNVPYFLSLRKPQWFSAPNPMLKTGDV